MKLEEIKRLIDQLKRDELKEYIKKNMKENEDYIFINYIEDCIDKTNNLSSDYKEYLENEIMPFFYEEKENN